MDRVGQNGVITIEKAKGLIKVDDAIQATRAAGEDGIVSGGVRVVLLHAQKSVADPLTESVNTIAKRDTLGWTQEGLSGGRSNDIPCVGLGELASAAAALAVG